MDGFHYNVSAEGWLKIKHRCDNILLYLYCLTVIAAALHLPCVLYANMYSRLQGPCDGTGWRQREEFTDFSGLSVPVTWPVHPAAASILHPEKWSLKAWSAWHLRWLTSTYSILYLFAVWLELQDLYFVLYLGHTHTHICFFRRNRGAAYLYFCLPCFPPAVALSPFDCTSLTY